MDSLDVGIIREMVLDPSSTNIQWDIRRSFRKIAQKLGTSDDTVRYRLKAMEDGVLRGWRLGINPRLLGYSTAFFFFDVNPEGIKPDVLQEVRKQPGVMWYVNYFGNFVGAMMAHRDLEALEAIQGRLSKAAQARVFFRNAASFPKCSLTLSEMDWRIIESIQREPRKAYSLVARQLHTSSRTIRRRLDRMIRERALYVLPDLDFKELEGEVSVSFNVFYASPEAKVGVDREVMARFSDRIVVAQLNDFDQGFFEFVLQNLSKIDEVKAAVSAIPGVKMVSARAMLDLVNLLGEVFRDDLSQLARATPPRVEGPLGASSRVPG